MSLNIPTTQEITDRSLANLEASLNQTAPLNDKAFLRVLSAMTGMTETELFKFGVERAKQNLALTATGNDLDLIGQEYGIVRKPAEAAVLTITLPATDGTVIPTSVSYVGNANAVIYFPQAEVVATGGLATSNVTAEDLGVIGNLNVSDTMTITIQIAGATTLATVTVVVNVGAELETDDAYRQRVLNAIRSTSGGGNANDYKTWAEQVGGVLQAYPYSGKPNASPPGIDPASVPPERTVFVESTDTDGIASGALLTEVRDSITTDPVTGAARQPLGLTDDTLHVESIIRTAIHVKITNFDEGTGVEATIKADIETALTTYFLSLNMFVVAIDLPSDRNDLITKLTISDVVQDVLKTGDASAELVEFEDTAGVPSPLDSYQIDAGELTKLGAVTYA